MNHPIIQMEHRGRLGNRMFQAMLALSLKENVPGARIHGLSLPEWRLVTPAATLKGPGLMVKGQRFNLQEIAWLLNSGLVNSVTLDVWAQRLNYFKPPEYYTELFKPRVKGRQISDDQILINIRAEDILDGWHPLYYPLPFSFYDYILKETQLAPVFMGQLEDNHYVAALRSRYPKATFLPLAPAMEDFETLRNARHVVLSISTYTWLAAWLSRRADTIHMPVSGVFNPLHANTLLIPLNDSRYRFYPVRIPKKRDRQNLSVVDWAKVPQDHGLYSADQIKFLTFKAIIGQQQG